MPVRRGINPSAKAWSEAQKNIISYLGRDALEQAEEEVEIFLRTEPRPRFQSEALAMRATIREQRHDLDGAEEDLLAADRLVKRSDYHRYTLALSLAGLYEARQAPEQAAHWLIRAIEITLEDPSISAGAPILGLLRARGERKPTPQELDLCWRAAHNSWKLLRLPGEPYIDDLARTAQMLVQAQGRPLPPKA